jgi:hypothetical protein
MQQFKVSEIQMRFSYIFYAYRFIPDEETFEENDVSSACMEIPSNYKPQFFFNAALSQSKVYTSLSVYCVRIMSYVLIIDVLVKVKLGNPSSYLEQWLHF